jgi:hypothetical protein
MLTAEQIAKGLRRIAQEGMVDAATFAKANRELAGAASKVWDELYQAYLQAGAPCGASEEGMIRWYRSQRPEAPRSNPFIAVLDGLTAAIVHVFGPDPKKQEQGVTVLCMLLVPTLLFAAIFGWWAGLAYLLAALIFGRE